MNLNDQKPIWNQRKVQINESKDNQQNSNIFLLIAKILKLAPSLNFNK